MDEKITIQNIFFRLGQLKLTEALKAFETFLGGHPFVGRDEELQRIQEDYRRMVNYRRQGYDDPDFRQQLTMLCRRLYHVVANANVEWLTHEVAFYREVKQRAMRQYQSSEHIRKELENFVTETAMLSLEPEAERQGKEQTLYTHHHAFMRQLFDRIVVSKQWSHAESDFYQQALCHAAVDTNDAQLLVSAITIACLTQFDEEKFLTLVHVFRHASNEQVRQRALVGWAMALRLLDLNIHEELKGKLQKLCRSHIAELLELQRQIEICIHTERDNETIQREIMPNIIRNNGFRITRHGVEEIEEDPMEDILHPDAEDERMERLEQDMQRMIDMQRKGTDIYFGGLRQTKRFAFFYTLSNWFVPFYMQHPDLGNIPEEVRTSKLYNAIIEHSPFCNSDRYSIALALPAVLSNLPQNLKEMAANAEFQDPMMMDVRKDSPHVIRQYYLQDLYRFFRLHSQLKDFTYDPFGQDKPMGFDAYALLDHDLFAKFDNEKVMLWRIRYHNAHHRYGVAMEELYFVEEQWPESEKGLAMMAREMLKMGNGSEAADRYERLLLIQPEKFSYQLNHAIALSQNEDFEDALEKLYHLDYDHPDDDRVLRALAWTLLSMGRFEQATAQYDKLLAHENAMSDDTLNAAYAAWFGHDTDRAVRLFQRYLKIETDKSLEECFIEDMELLKANGITSLDELIMTNMVLLDD